MINKCDLCNEKLIDSKEIIIKNGKSYTLEVKQCTKCSHSYSNPYDVEKLRKELNPSFFDKIRRFIFNINKIESLSFFRGKVL